MGVGGKTKLYVIVNEHKEKFILVGQVFNYYSTKKVNIKLN